METLIGKVFEHLKSKGAIRTQAEFAATLELTNSYISQLRKQNTDLPQAVKKKLHEKFSISTLWLASDGKQGRMIEPIITPDNPEKNNPQNDIGQENGTSVDVSLFPPSKTGNIPMESTYLQIIANLAETVKSQQEDLSKLRQSSFSPPLNLNYKKKDKKPEGGTSKPK